MKKKLLIFGVIASIAALAVIVAIENDKKANTYRLEYGSEYDPYKLLGVSKDVETFSVDVNPSVMGTYVVEWEEKGEKESKEVIVEDTKEPKIELIQDASSTKKISANGGFLLVGNLNKIYDEVDGDMKKVEVVDKETFDSISSDVESFYDKTKKNTFKSNEDVEAYKIDRVEFGYTVIYSDLDTTKEGVYTVNVLTIDKNYNTASVEYKIEVVAEGTKIAKEELAAGAEDSEIGELAYHLANEQTDNGESTESEGTAGTTDTSGTSEGTSSQNSTAPVTPITSTNNAVANAALGRVGQSLACDQLVTYALMDAGMIAGGEQWINYIGVYYFPELSTAVSASSAQAGDIIYYDNGGTGSAHVAIYLGNGQAVHGGYLGLNVEVQSVNIPGASTPRYYRFTSVMSWDQIFAALMDSPNVESGTVSGSTTTTTTPSDNGNGGGGGTTTYTSTITVDNVTLNLESSTPIDTDAVMNYVMKYVSGEITYDQMIANIKALGYQVK